VRILRSKGVSFTKLPEKAEAGVEREPLSRGLKPSPKSASAHSADMGNQGPIEPEYLSEYLETDPELILRQFISILDKVVRKPRSLRRFSLQAYVDRTLLGEALWHEFYAQWERTSETAIDKTVHAKLREKWVSKVHPYAQHETDWHQPAKDQNAEIIQKVTPPVPDSAFHGRWRKALWRSNNGKPDYVETANMIACHLFEQEYTISGEPRRDSQNPNKSSGFGLVFRRGDLIASSADNPLRPEQHQPASPWAQPEETYYFQPDVAADIFNVLTNDELSPTSLHPSWFGERLYDHFGSLKQDCEVPEINKKSLFDLHNDVRSFYRKLAKSERFRRAFRENDKARLEALLPPNAHVLLSRISAKSTNRDRNSLIRTGKIIAHAAEIPFDTKTPTEVFQQRLAYFTSSAGQAEIKRNESFARIWRSSVTFSLRTLRHWADPNGRIKVGKDRQNYDISSTPVAQAILSNFDETAFDTQSGLVFGRKSYSWQNEPGDGELLKMSRAEVVLSSTKDDKREALWALMRLGGEVRNRTLHFSTRQNIMSVLTGGFLTSFKNEEQKLHLSNRGGNVADEDAISALGELLTFDERIASQILADDLNRLGFADFVPAEKIEPLTKLLTEDTAHDTIVTPKFMSVLRKIRNLSTTDDVSVAKELEALSGLSLHNLSKGKTGLNHFRLGILRKVYDLRFPLWLGKKQSDPDLMRGVVEAVINAKSERRQAFNKNTKAYEDPDTLVNDLLTRSETLKDLFSAFARETLLEKEPDDEIDPSEKHSDPYTADKAEQKRQSAWIEELRQEVFAHLFSKCLKDSKLDWIWHVREAEEPLGRAVQASDLSVSSTSWKGWHRQFYAWLYLVPVDQVALLRHQFRKTAVLEQKADGETDLVFQKQLGEIDHLMALYCRVQSAGFDGTEHERGKALGKVFYDDPDLFEQVYSTHADDHDVTFPGTRRGLRQMRRFGSLTALEGIFTKHKVSNEEVKSFKDLAENRNLEIFAKRIELHDQINKLAKEKTPDAVALGQACSQYRELAVNVAQHNFATSAARLSEFARLHHLTMRILARLTDFTLMWERDLLFLVLGMIYHRTPIQDVSIEEIGNGKDQAVGFYALNPENPSGPRQFFAIRQEQMGYASVAYQLVPLLSEEEKASLNRYFGIPEQENPKDVQAAKEKKAKNKLARQSQFARGKGKIRNDFAHFNVIDLKGKRLNLLYLVNAVRSLLSYDRKLKNAVPKAVSDILLDEGLVVEWQLREDRLTRTRLHPRMEKHLDMTYRHTADDYIFWLPQTSKRFTSMVKALFEFDRGGYRALEKEDGKLKARGKLEYPRHFLETWKDRVPRDIF
jgi:hypothetical protein